MYYAVKVGRKTGIFEDWEECKKQVHKYSGAEYKKFSSLKEANSYLKDKKLDTSDWYSKGEKELRMIPKKDEVIAYIDGSFRPSDKSFSYGIVMIMDDGSEIEMSKRYHKHSDADLRNVIGELYSSVTAVQQAIRMEKKKIEIRYDYAGIRNWVFGTWEAKTETTRRYRDKIRELANTINIEFTKIKAHSGDEYNGKADKLAKNAE